MKSKLHNYIEDLIWEHIEEELKLWKDICICDQCRLNIAAHVLNHTKPRYYATQNGYSHYVHDSQSGEQLVADVTLGITAAIRVVAKSPNHDSTLGSE
ncbi:MAG: hypothetical protein B6244_11495 [Candidatus Cloacimonetes bacterium 4572_55]|nr:MAG: hypothetical protein B6244_11495 [Candidatus Cloacimonetes bacterium 4572_55]